MSNEEFQSYPGRTEMLELIRQRESQGASQDQRETGANAYPLCLSPGPACILPPAIES
jgi:hypothetical protein